MSVGEKSREDVHIYREEQRGVAVLWVTIGGELSLVVWIDMHVHVEQIAWEIREGNFEFYIVLVIHAMHTRSPIWLWRVWCVMRN